MNEPKLINGALCQICGKHIQYDEQWGWLKTKKPVKTLFFHMECYKNLRKINKKG